MAGVIAEWARDVRGGPGMTVAVYPRATADEMLPEGRVVDTAHRRIVIAWPKAGSPQAGSAVEA